MPERSRDDITRDEAGRPESQWHKFTTPEGTMWDVGRSLSLDLSDEDLEQLVGTAGPWLYKFLRFALKASMNPDPTCDPDEKYGVAMMMSGHLGDNRVLPLTTIGAGGASLEAAMIRLSEWCRETQREQDTAMRLGNGVPVIKYVHPLAGGD